jgi:hypothetical protein
VSQSDVRQDYEFPAGPPHRFSAWRDEYGRVHEDVPRCCGSTRPRNSWSKIPGECHRKGVVQRGVERGWRVDRERWFCLQHDPARGDEKRVAEAAPTMRELLAEALELMPRTKRAAAWRERTQALLDQTEARHVH